MTALTYFINNKNTETLHDTLQILSTEKILRAEEE